MSYLNVSDNLNKIIKQICSQSFQILSRLEIKGVMQFHVHEKYVEMDLRDMGRTHLKLLYF